LTIVPASLVQRLRRGAADLRQRRLARDGVWVAAGHGVTAIAGLVSIRLFTELAPQSVFGAANLLIGMLTLGMHALLAPITQAQIRYHTTYNDKGEGDAYTWLVLRLAAGAALAIVALVAVVLVVWPDARAGAGLSVIGWLAAWVAVSTWRNVSIGRVHAERRQRRYSLWVGTEAVLLMACTAGTLALWPTVEGYIAGQVMATAIAASGFGWSAVRVSTARPWPDLREAAWRQIRSYGAPFSAFMIMGWLASLSERYVLAAQLDIAAVGVYVAAFAIASRPAMMAGGLLTDVFRATLFSSQSRGIEAHARQAFHLWLGLQILASLALVLLFSIFGNLVSTLLLAEGYRQGAPAIMSWVAGAYGILAIALALENRIFSLEQPRRLMAVKAVSAVTNIGLALILIPVWGVVGAAMANTAGQSVYLLGCIAVLYGERMRLPVARVWRFP
jgi:O-antigen/teichoic acid export membrane protein